MGAEVGRGVSKSYMEMLAGAEAAEKQAPPVQPPTMQESMVRWYDKMTEDTTHTLHFDIAVNNVFKQAQEMLLRKHRDYGPRNIADAPGGPMNGLRVRMYDKLARINHLAETGAEPANEALRDSFLDLLNYSAIALLLLDGEWPGV